MRSPTSGNSAEAQVLAAFARRNLCVLVPFGDGHPYDLVVHVERSLFIRVQCKTARRSGGCMIFKSSSTDHGRGAQSYLGRADVFGVYLPDAASTYLVPVDAVAAFEGRLRLEPTRNNQQQGVTFASDFEIDRWTDASLAALAEGVHQIQARARLA